MTAPEYPVLLPFATRWRDNDQYGHLNNTVYYEAMDTAINTWMIREAGLDPMRGEAIGLCVASSCEFHASAAFPDPLQVGIAVERLGRTSIAWSLGIRRADGREQLATGRFVHVFVDAATRRPVPVPADVRTAVSARLLA